MTYMIMSSGENFWLKKYFQVDVLAPQMALRPEYDRQSIRQDHLYKSEYPNILTWIKWEGRGMVVG